MAEAENCVKDSIVETVRKLLPVKHILKEYLGGNYEDEDIDEDVTSVMSTTTKNNLRKLVKAEIENTLKVNAEEAITPKEDVDKVEEEIAIPLETNYLPHPDNLESQSTKEEEVVEDTIKDANAELYDMAETKDEVQVNTETPVEKDEIITMDETQIEELEQFQEQLDSGDSESLVVEDRKVEEEEKKEPEPEIKMVIIQPTDKEKTTKSTKKVIEEVEKESIKEKSSAKSNRDEFEPKPSIEDEDDNFSFFDDAAEE
jgi:hypothetical protein